MMTWQLLPHNQKQKKKKKNASYVPLLPNLLRSFTLLTAMFPSKTKKAAMSNKFPLIKSHDIFKSN